jgi:hypothetical protein
MSCRCKECNNPVDCGDIVCPMCDTKIEGGVCDIAPPTCNDGVHCDQIICEVKPNLFKVKHDNGSYGLKWIPPT